MALYDLSLVTAALVRLVREHVARSPAWLPRPAPKVSPNPPDLLDPDSIGLYLYHVREEPHAKNVAPPGPGSSPVQLTPMGLSLYYVLTAKGIADQENATYNEQRMVGCALKALHDFPCVDDSTTIGGVSILQSAGIDGHKNRLRIDLNPMLPDHALQYWSASSSSPRLAAYYQVSVVYLEPERVQTRTSRVLSYGVYGFLHGNPRLDASVNRLSISVPGSAAPRNVELRPAEVPYDAQFTLLGDALAGHEIKLLLRGVTAPHALLLDDSWGVVATNDQISATVRETVDGQPILPGIYSLSASVTSERPDPAGGVRRFERKSNEVPITITPRVAAPGALGSGGVFQVEGAVFSAPGIALDRVAVHFDELNLQQGSAGALLPGEFGVIDAHHLEVRIPLATQAGVHAVRVVVLGVEAPPVFLEVP